MKDRTTSDEALILASLHFARLYASIRTMSPASRAVVENMVTLIEEPRTSREDRLLSASTLAEVLYPQEPEDIG